MSVVIRGLEPVVHDNRGNITRCWIEIDYGRTPSPTARPARIVDGAPTCLWCAQRNPNNGAMGLVHPLATEDPTP